MNIAEKPHCYAKAAFVGGPRSWRDVSGIFSVESLIPSFGDRVAGILRFFHVLSL